MKISATIIFSIVAIPVFLIAYLLWPRKCEFYEPTSFSSGDGSVVINKELMVCPASIFGDVISSRLSFNARDGRVLFAMIYPEADKHDVNIDTYGENSFRISSPGLKGEGDHIYEMQISFGK